jgi:hypothetical protein
MTYYRRINSRTLNHDVQQQDNMVTFMKPISRAIYPNYFSIPDASNNSLIVSNGSPYSATASPNLTFDGTDLKIYGNVETTGNVETYGNTDLYGNLDVSGTILASQYLPGQVVNVSMLSNSDLSQTTQTINQSATAIIFSYSYTPKITNSYLLFEYQTIYVLGGGNNDEAYAYMYVNDPTEQTISSTYQHWINSSGGGTRSGTIFPIVGRYTNTNTSAKTIRVEVFNNTDSDPMVVQGNNSTWLKITEIGR